MAIDYAAVTEAEWDLRIDPNTPELTMYTAPCNLRGKRLLGAVP